MSFEVFFNTRGQTYAMEREMNNAICFFHIYDNDAKIWLEITDQNEIEWVAQLCETAIGQTLAEYINANPRDKKSIQVQQDYTKSIRIGVQGYDYETMYGPPVRNSCVDLNFPFEGHVTRLDYNNLRNGHVNIPGNEIGIIIGKGENCIKSQFSISDLLNKKQGFENIEITADDNFRFYDSFAVMQQTYEKRD